MASSFWGRSGQEAVQHDVSHALAKGDPTALGVALRRITLLEIRGHVLGAISRQGAGEPVLTRKIVAAIMQLQAVAVSRTKSRASSMP